MGKRESRQTKDLKRFLKEQGLTSTYRTWYRIQKNKKIILEHDFHRTDLTVKRAKIVVVREWGRTNVRDARTLKILATTRRSIEDTIKSIYSDIKESFDTEVNDKSSKAVVKRKQLELLNTYDLKYYNKQLGRLRIVTISNKAIRRKYGNVVVDVILYKGPDIKKRVQARSKSGFDLAVKRERIQAINDALHNAMAVAGFTATGWDLIDYWFEYRRDVYGV